MYRMERQRQSKSFEWVTKKNFFEDSKKKRKKNVREYLLIFLFYMHIRIDITCIFFRYFKAFFKELFINFNFFLKEKYMSGYKVL